MDRHRIDEVTVCRLETAVTSAPAPMKQESRR
jgi:hypothetical protein